MPPIKSGDPWWLALLQHEAKPEAALANLAASCGWHPQVGAAQRKLEQRGGGITAKLALLVALLAAAVAYAFASMNGGVVL